MTSQVSDGSGAEFCVCWIVRHSASDSVHGVVVEHLQEKHGTADKSTTLEVGESCLAPNPEKEGNK